MLDNRSDFLQTGNTTINSQGGHPTVAAVGPAQGCPRAVCQRRTKMLLSPACRSAKCCQRMLHRMQRRTSSSRLRRDASREERGWLVRRPLIGFPDRGSARRVVMRPSSGGRVDRSLSVRSSRARLSEQAAAGKLLSLRERTCRHGGPLECAIFLASKVLQQWSQQWCFPVIATQKGLIAHMLPCLSSRKGFL